MNSQTVHMGLDVSKLKIDVCVLLPDGERLRTKISNSRAGFVELLNWLHGIELNTVHACLEPTGPYSKGIAYFLFNAGIRVALVNSYAVKSHGRSKKFRQKTDRIDAYLLADYGLKNDLPAWTPPSETAAELRALQHRLANIDEQIRQEENRLEAVDSAVVREDIEENLGRLYVRRRRLEKAATNLVKTDERLDANFVILKSIIGIGEKSAIRLLALVQFEQFKYGRQVGCFSGLTPRQHESGTSVHAAPTISRMGSDELRAALYFPAMVAMQHNPQMREFAERLRQKNKPAKVIICAVMRKLLVLCHTLIQRQELYDPQHGSAWPQPAG